MLKITFKYILSASSFPPKRPKKNKFSFNHND